MMNRPYIMYTDEELSTEIWKDIKGYEGLYQVSNLGRVKSVERKVRHNYGGLKTVPERILKGSPDGDGYLYVSLSKENHKRNPKIHKLVANAFLLNPDNLPQVNHIDENKENNRVSNLEWCSSLYNLQYSDIIHKGNLARSRAVKQYSLNGEFLNEFNSISEARKAINAKSHIGIIKCCQHKQKTSYGYKWEYA